MRDDIQFAAAGESRTHEFREHVAAFPLEVSADEQQPQRAIVRRSFVADASAMLHVDGERNDMHPRGVDPTGKDGLGRPA